MSFADDFAMQAAIERVRLNSRRSECVGGMMLMLLDAVASLTASEIDTLNRLRSETAVIDARLVHLQTSEYIYREREHQQKQVDRPAHKKTNHSGRQTPNKPLAECACQCAQCLGEMFIDEPRLPVPVTTLQGRQSGEVHYFPDDIERAARRMERWTPWNMRKRRTRRYEGYHRAG